MNSEQLDVSRQLDDSQHLDNTRRLDGDWRHRVCEDERLARIVWARLAEPRDATAHRLIDNHGHRDALAHVLDDPTRYENFIGRWEALDLPEQLRRVRTLGARIIVPGETEWPDGVDDLAEPPHALFVLGDGDLAELASSSVALVGARAATHYEQRTAAELALGVGNHGFNVISGGAFGIDACAHRGALVGSAATVCVVAGGVDRVYPSAHEELFRRMRERGVIVSEVPLGYAPMRQRFLHRNRLIAALSPGTIVVEAGLRSGSLSTARRAEEIHRVVGAVPGPVNSPASVGCHDLIREGAAVLITGADDIVELVGNYGATRTTKDTLPALVKPEDCLAAETRLVWDALPLRRPAPLENVARACGRSPRDTLSALGELIAMGMARRQTDGWMKG